MQIEEIRSFENWSELEHSWRRLLDDADDHSPFMTWEWVDAWRRTFGKGQRLWVLVCRDGNDVVGIVPFVVSEIVKRRTPLRVARLLGNGLSDRLRILIRQDAAAAVARHVATGTGAWDLFELEDLDPEADSTAAFAAALVQAGIRASCKHSHECPYLAVRGAWDAFYENTVGKKIRGTNRTKLRKLEAMGSVRFRFVTEAADFDRALTAIKGMDERTEYHGQPRTRPFDSPAGADFFDEFGKAFAQRGWLFLGMLELDEKPIAYRFCFRYKKRHFDFFPGFAPPLFKLSPGRLLTAEILKNCFEQGIEEIDFLRGVEEWKKEWTQTSRHNRAITAQNHSWSSRARVFVHGLGS